SRACPVPKRTIPGAPASPLGSTPGHGVVLGSGRWIIDLAGGATSVAPVFGMLRKWRRRRLDKLPFPATWLRILRERVPYYRLLSHDEQTQLQKLVRVFLSEKEFEGCGGLEMTDEIR